MADRNEFINLIVRLRDDSAAEFAKLRGEIAAVNAATEDHNRSLEESNKRVGESYKATTREMKTLIDTAERGGVQKAMFGVERQLRDVGRAIDDDREKLDSFSGAGARAVDQFKETRNQVDRIGDSLRTAKNERQALLAVERQGSQLTDDQRTKLERIRSTIKQLEADQKAWNAQMEKLGANDQVQHFTKLERQIDKNVGKMRELSKEAEQYNRLFERDEHSNALQNQILKVEQMSRALAKVRADEQASSTAREVAERNLQAETNKLIVLRSESGDILEHEASTFGENVKRAELQRASEEEILKIRQRMEQVSRARGQNVDDSAALVDQTRQLERQEQALRRLGVESEHLNEIRLDNATIEHQAQEAKGMELTSRDARQLEQDKRRLVAATNAYDQSIKRAATSQAAFNRASGTEGIKPEHIEALHVRADADKTSAITAHEELVRLAGGDIHTNVDLDIGKALVEAEAFNAVKERMGRPPDSGSGGGGLKGWWQGFTEEMNQSSNQIAAFDNFLRGLLTLGIAVFFNQLIVLAGAAAGGLTALASSAIMAGGALGGGLVAGITQALPVLGLLGAAFYRWQAVFQAAQQQQLYSQQQSYKGAAQNKKLADTTDAVTNAEDQLVQAHRRVKDANDQVSQAQIALTEARRQARRDLEDLILAEKSAELAARGAALSQQDAQAALRQSLSTGQTGQLEQRSLAIDEANQNATKSVVDLARAHEDMSRRVAGGPDQMPGVVSAEKNLRSAREAVVQAKEAVDQAQRGLEKASRGADIAGANITAAEGKLNFLLGRMSSAEKAMYRTVMSLQDAFRHAAEKVTEPLTVAVTKGMNRVIVLMKDPRILGAFTGLAKEMGDQAGAMFRSFTDRKTISQFLGFIADAKTNLKPLREIFDSIGHAFLNIGTAAAPALHQIFTWLDRVTKSFATWTGSKAGQKAMTDFFKEGVVHLKAWAGLFGSIGRLFMAIIGPGGGAQSGLGLVRSITNEINKLTSAINKHPEGMQKFFAGSVAVLKVIAPVIGQIATAISDQFGDTKSVQAFAGFLQQVLVPALKNFLHFVSLGTKALGEFLKIPGMGQLMQFGVTLALVGGLVGKLGTLLEPGVKLIKNAGDIAEATKGSWAKLAEKADKAATSVFDFGGRLTMGAKMGEAAGQGGKLTSMFTKLGPIVERAGLMMGAAADIALGPWGLAIAGVILAIVLLDKKFHFLEPTFKWLKGAFGDVINWLKTHWPLVLTILTGPFGLAVTLIAKHWKGISHAASSAFNTIKGIIGDGVHWITSHLRKLGQDILDILPSPFRHAGHAAADGLISGLKSIGGFFAGIGKWLFQHVIKPIYDFFEIKSPSGLFKRIGSNLVDGLIEGFKGLPKLLLGAIKDMGQALMDIGGEIGSWVRKGLEKIPGGKLILGAAGKIKGLLGLAEGGPVPGSGEGDIVPAMLTPGEHVWTKREVQAAGGHGIMFALRKFFGGGGQGSGGGYAQGGQVQAQQASGGGANFNVSFGQALAAMDDFAKLFRAAWRGLWTIVNADTRKQFKNVGDDFADLYRRIDSIQDKIGTRVTSGWSSIERKVRSNASDLSDGVTKSFDSLQNAVYRSLRYIVTEAGSTLKGYGASLPHVTIASPPSLAKADGGWIGSEGERGRDAVHTVLGRGEAVLNWAHQKVVNSALWNQYGTTLSGLFKRTNAYHAGGQGQAPGYAKGGEVPGGSRFQKLVGAANDVSSHNFPYVWGGGHGMPDDPSHVHGYDCSGAVSYIVRAAGYNVPISTSGNMGGWGFPSGQGQATVFYNPEHTFMRIGDRYWGTSGFARPNGGAGWFNQKPSDAYLKRFHAIHLPDLGAAPDSIEGDIATPKLHGPAGLRQFGNRVLAKVVSAVNRYVQDKMPNDAQGQSLEGIAQPGPGQLSIARTIMQVAHRLNASAKVLLAAIETGIVESGLRNLSYGDRDSVGVFQQRPSAGWTGLRNVPKAAQEFISRAMKISGGTAGQIAQAVQVSAFPDRYDAAKEQAIAVLKKIHAPEFAVGGTVPGSEGQAVPIIAHAGEWVLNKVQQSKLAGLIGSGIGSLRNYLGFSGGPTSFAGGGEVKNVPFYAQTRRAEEDARHERVLAAAKKAHNKEEIDAENKLHATRLKNITAYEKREARWAELHPEGARLRGIARGSYTLPMLMPETPTGVTREVSRDFRTMRAPIRSGTQGNRYFQNLNALTGENGLFDTMTTALESFTTSLALKTRQAAIKIKRVGGKWKAVGSPNFDQATAEMNDLSQEIDKMHDFGGQLAKAGKSVGNHIKQIDSRIKKIQDAPGKVTDAQQKEIDSLSTTKLRLQSGQRSIQDRIKANNEALQQAAEDLYAKQLDKFTKDTDANIKAIGEKSGVKGINLSTFASVANAIGRTSDIRKIQQQQLDNMNAQSSALQQAITDATNAGYTDYANQLKDQLQTLWGQIQEQTEQKLKDAIADVQATADEANRRSDLKGRLADVVALVSPQRAAQMREAVNAEKGQTLTTERDALLAQAGGRAGYESLLAQPIESLSEVQKTLISSIGDLDVQVQENTAQQKELATATRQATIDALNNRAQFGTGVTGALTDIVNKIGAASGAVDTNQLIAIAQQTATILSQQFGGLAGQFQEITGISLDGSNPMSLVGQMQGVLNNWDTITAGMTETQKSQLQDLVNTILANTSATLDNTDQLTQLTGAQNMQSFSSAGWRAFRQAIFNGAGGLLPEYNIPQMQTGGFVTKTGVFQLHEGEFVVNPDQSNLPPTQEGDINVNVNMVREQADPVEIAHRTMWERRRVGRR